MRPKVKTVRSACQRDGNASPESFARLSFVLVSLVLSAGLAPADESELRIVAPSLGRPVFAQPGATISVVATGIDPSAEFRLLHPRVEGASYRLERVNQGGTPIESGAVQLRLPENTPLRTYDLEIRSAGKSSLARHAVSVCRIVDSLRVVHLADMNIGDIQSPDFDRRLQTEINLIGPDVIVGTGDFLDASHPQLNEGWSALIDFFCGFDAPFVLACGDHDDGERFARNLAASPIGVVECGPFQIVVLSDHNLAPFAVDADQIRWVEDTLKTPLSTRSRIVVSHASAPTLLHLWQRNGILKERMASASLVAWFAGGGRELSPRELGDLLTAVKPMRFFRTAAASRAVASGGDGLSRFRWVNIAANHDVSHQNQADVLSIERSFVVGRVDCRHEVGIVEGNQSAITAINNNDSSIAGAGLFVRLPKLSAERPWVRGATLAQCADLGTEWECALKFDLPPKSSLLAQVGVGPPPPETRIDVKLEVPSRLQSKPRLGEDGLLYWTASAARGSILLENHSSSPVDCSPLVRFDGEVVAWKAAGQVDDFVATARLTIAPETTQQLQLDLSAARVVPGSRSLVFYVNDGRTRTPLELRVDVAQERGAVP